MVNNNGIPAEVKKPFETVYEIKNEIEEIRLPKLSEITDKDGKVKLPPELIEKLWDPNARFRTDLMVFPAWSEEWETLKISCMASNCGNTYRSEWKHANCSYSYPSSIQWSTYARLKCPSCYTIADISRWRFRCHGGGHSYEKTDINTLTVLMIEVLGKSDASREFITKFLTSAKDMF